MLTVWRLRGAGACLPSGDVGELEHAYRLETEGSWSMLTVWRPRGAGAGFIGAKAFVIAVSSKRRKIFSGWVTTTEHKWSSKRTVSAVSKLAKQALQYNSI